MVRKFFGTNHAQQVSGKGDSGKRNELLELKRNTKQAKVLAIVALSLSLLQLLQVLIRFYLK
jgi:hypothetical protein